MNPQEPESSMFPNPTRRSALAAGFGAVLTGTAEAAHRLGTETLLVVPGAVHIPWLKDHDPVPNDLCDQRAKAAIARLVPLAEKLGVYLNIENIFFNGYLMTPGEMNAFVDGFKSK